MLGEDAMINVISGIAEVWICLVFLRSVLHQKDSLKKLDWIWIGVFSGLLGTAIAYSRDFSYVSVSGMIISALLCSIIIWLMQRVDFLIILSVSWTYYSTISIIQILFSFLMMGIVIYDVESQEMVGEYINITDSVRSIIYLLSCMLIYGILIKIRDYLKEKELDLKDYSIILLLFNIVLTFVLGKYNRLLQEMTITMGKIEEVKVFSFTFTILFVVAIAFIFLKNKMIEKENTTLLLSDEITKRRYQELSDLISMNNQMIHDVNNHFLILQEYARIEGADSVFDYIENIRNDYNVSSRKRWTGDYIVDFILNQKKFEAAQKGIEMSIHTDYGIRMPITESEICVVLGNLLDNAIEAASMVKDEKRWIEIIIGQQNQMLFLKIRNNYTRELIIKKGEYQTTKQNKETHGYGIKSVKRIVNRQNGAIRIRTGNQIFEVMISFFSTKEEVNRSEDNVTREKDHVSKIILVDLVINVLLFTNYCTGKVIGGAYIDWGILAYSCLIGLSVGEILFLKSGYQKENDNIYVGQAIMSILVKVTCLIVRFLLFRFNI